jgi:hypothetical protein
VVGDGVGRATARLLIELKLDLRRVASAHGADGRYSFSFDVALIARLPSTSFAPGRHERL